MKKSFLILLVAGFSSLSSLQAAVLYDLNSTILDGGTGANTFFVANSHGSPAGLSYSETGPTLTDTLASGTSYTYFVGNMASATLTNLGDSITLSFQLTPSSTSAFNNASGTFRVGLFNSNGTQLSENVAGNGAAALNDDTGYVATYNPRSSATGNVIRQRSGGNNNLWDSGRYTTVAGSPELNSPGTGVITGTFTLSLVATGVEITSMINGGPAQTVIDTSGLVTTFDSFSIFGLSGSANPTLTFSELTVTYNAVPEPSTYVMLGLGLAALFLLRRRSRQIGTSK